jgi:hypothetical protein
MDSSPQSITIRNTKTTYITTIELLPIISNTNRSESKLTLDIFISFIFIINNNHYAKQLHIKSNHLEQPSAIKPNLQLFESLLPHPNTNPSFFIEAVIHPEIK